MIPNFEIPDKEITKLQKFSKQKQNEPILILTHANPDGDAIGSALAAEFLLKNMGFKTQIACVDPVPENFKFLKQATQFTQTFDLEDFKAVAFLDCGDKRMTKFEKKHPNLFSDEIFKINIDHHPSNDSFGDINFVIPEASSACELLYWIFKELEITISTEIATAMLLGIYTDTGAFMHQNTSPTTYKTAGELVKLGGNTQKIIKNVFHTYEPLKLKLWSKVLDELYITDDGVAMVGIKQEDYESVGCNRNDLAGVIDLINAIPEVNYSVILSEDTKGNVKASLRTRKEGVDVKELAEKFGGGGHIKASGFTVAEKRLKKEVKWKIA